MGQQLSSWLGVGAGVVKQAVVGLELVDSPLRDDS